MKVAFHFICLLLIFSCKRDLKSTTETIEYTSLDTILDVDSLNLADKKVPIPLTKDVAYQTLIEYFEPKGYFPEEKITLDTLLVNEFEYQPMCIGLDTLYQIHLNNDKIIDGIVTYYKMPCGASGTNWRPHRAIITNINGRYQIISTDLIPNYYLIDRITQNNSATYIHGHILDLKTREYIKSYKAIIKK